jgi:hypothetical protein
VGGRRVAAANICLQFRLSRRPTISLTVEELELLLASSSYCAVHSVIKVRIQVTGPK